MSKRNRIFSLASFILRTLEEIGEGTADVFLPDRYPHTRLTRDLLGLGSTHRFEQRTFSTTLNRLKRQGLVRRSNRGARVVWRLTAQGIRRIRENPIYDAVPARDGVQRIFIFDIPQPLARHRAWMRMELLYHDYRPLQKSVWVGYRPLDETFLDALDARGLMRCVHIFMVKKEGTLQP